MSRKDARKGKARRRKRDAGSKDVCPTGSVLLLHGRVPTKSEASARRYDGGKLDVIVIDESNSFSSKGDGKREYLTIVCTRTSDPRKMVECLKFVPVRKGVRSKYSNTGDYDRLRIIRYLARQDIRIVERHRRIDCDALDSPEKKKRFYMGILADVLGDALDLDPDREMDVLIDLPPLDIKDMIEDLGIMEVESGRMIRWYETRPSASTPLLQVHDYIAGVVSDAVEGIDESVELMEMLRKRLKK